MNLFRSSSFKWIRLRFINHANISHLFCCSLYGCLTYPFRNDTATWNSTGILRFVMAIKSIGWWYVRLINESGTDHFYMKSSWAVLLLSGFGSGESWNRRHGTKFDTDTNDWIDLLWYLRIQKPFIVHIDCIRFNFYFWNGVLSFVLITWIE